MSDALSRASCDMPSVETGPLLDEPQDQPPHWVCLACDQAYTEEMPVL